jgi:hypothetical protein
MWRVTQRGCCGWLTDVAQPFPVSSSESWPFRPHQSRVAGTQTKHASIACFDCVARSAFPPFPRPSSLLVHFLIPTSLLVPPGAPRSLCSPRHHPPPTSRLQVNSLKHRCHKTIPSYCIPLSKLIYGTFPLANLRPLLSASATPPTY